MSFGPEITKSEPLIATDKWFLYFPMLKWRERSEQDEEIFLCITYVFNDIFFDRM